MTWPRVKRWIGTHPGWAITPVAAPCGLAVLLFVSMPRVFVNPMVLDRAPGLLLFAAGVLVAGVAASWSCFVGCLVGRAGLPIRKLWPKDTEKALLAGCLLGGVLVIGWAAASDGEIKSWPLVLLFVVTMGVIIGAAAGIPALGFVYVGLRVADWITRRQIRRGKWEVIKPVERPKEQP